MVEEGKQVRIGEIPAVGDWFCEGEVSYKTWFWS